LRNKRHLRKPRHDLAIDAIRRRETRDRAHHALASQPLELFAPTAEPDEVAFRQELAVAMESEPLGEPTEFPMYPPAIKEPYRTRRFECGEALYRSIGVPRDDKPARIRQLTKNFEFFGAPAAFFFAMDRQMGLGQWAHLGMLMQTICLVAESRGLATCMQESWMTRNLLVRRFFRIPEEWQFYCGMAVGYADESAPINSWRTERASVDEVASFFS
jgi:hypothetical protein